MRAIAMFCYVLQENKMYCAEVASVVWRSYQILWQIQLFKESKAGTRNAERMLLKSGYHLTLTIGGAVKMKQRTL